MKITAINLYQYKIRHQALYPFEDRSAGPLDIYPEYAQDQFKAPMKMSGQAADGERSGVFLVISTDEGIEGVHGPIEYRSQLLTILDGLAGHLVGRDPLENRLLWDIMSRFDRHSRSGVMLMAISSVDIALWDIKGKALGRPVYKLLGGGRPRIRPYISMLGFSVEPKRACARALQIKQAGYQAQKWFFRYGPDAGAEGMRKNLDLAFALRETLGQDYSLMFDCWMSWTLSYAREIFRELAQVRPLWVEEVLRPHMFDAYRQLKQETSIPLSAGEHLYTRMEVNPYLKEGVFAVMQSDPEWCGGITEALRLGDLCEVYGTTFIPHGHSLLPAMHVVAAMSPDISPYCEYLLAFMDQKTAFFKEKRLGDDGFLHINETPGLGEDIDYERLLETTLIREFAI